jgi:hypothetical protein
MSPRKRGKTGSKLAGKGVFTPSGEKPYEVHYDLDESESSVRGARVALMGKVNAVDTAIRLLGGGNVKQVKTPMSEKDRLRRSAAMKASWRERRGAQHKKN